MTSLPGNFSPHGAVDLAALAKQREIREAAAAGAGGGASAAAIVVDVTDSTFEHDVVQQSMTVPVVIDFWATWCAPCKQLSPILEKFAAADAGKWVLAKVDVDANPQLSAAAQVQSIPTVMVVWQGQVIPGFAGALPEAQVRDFLDQVIALTGDNDSAPEGETEPGGEGEAVDPAVEAAESALERNDFDAAAAAYERLLTERPGDPAAETGLARVRLMQRTEGHQADQVLAAAAAQPTDVPAQTLAADFELLGGEVEPAFDRLLTLVAAQTGDEREQAKEHLLSLLDLVGNEDPRVLSARRRLASALF